MAHPVIIGLPRRDLIELGLNPGPHLGPILAACYEAQIDGEFSTHEDGIEYARRTFL